MRCITYLWMQKSKEQLYKKIKYLKTKDEFEEDIKKIQKDYDNLFDEETAALLIVDELGENKQNICKIKDLDKGKECTIYGKITKINNQRNFNRKNGSLGRVVNLELTDETDTCNLVLWDKDVDLVKNKKIKKNTSIKIINGYVKDGYNGLEINVGRWGLIEVLEEEHTFINIKDEIKEKISLSGELVEVQPTKSFFKDNGEFGFVTNIKVQTKNGTKQITIWDEKVKELQKFKQGDRIKINNFDIKQKNDNQEIHLNGRGYIKKI